MERSVPRRQFLGLGSAAVALSIAGCGFQDPDDSDADTNGVDDPTADPNGVDETDDSHEVMVVVEIDREELQAAQQEVQAAQQEAQQGVAEGELSEEEAQQIVQEARDELEALQQELIDESISAVEEHVEGISDLSIVEAEPEFGVVLLEGDGDSLVEVLALDAVQAILDGSEYENVRGS